MKTKKHLEKRRLELATAIVRLNTINRFAAHHRIIPSVLLIIGWLAIGISLIIKLINASSNISFLLGLAMGVFLSGLICSYMNYKFIDKEIDGVE